jgi:hypothetical protein
VLCDPRWLTWAEVDGRWDEVGPVAGEWVVLFDLMRVLSSAYGPNHVRLVAWWEG